MAREPPSEGVAQHEGHHGLVGGEGGSHLVGAWKIGEPQRAETGIRLRQPNPNLQLLELQSLQLPQQILPRVGIGIDLRQRSLNGGDLTEQRLPTLGDGSRGCDGLDHAAGVQPVQQHP